jgi:hypothetical protein
MRILRSLSVNENTRKDFNRKRRIRGKTLCVNGKYAKRLYAYSHNTPRDIKQSTTPLIITRHEKFFRFFLSILEGLD